MNAGQSTSDQDRRTKFVALASELRPELHRYCARLMGSVIDGEDVVQDAFARALAALGEIEEMPQIRPWLFRIAHNRALDLLRSRAGRRAEPMEAAADVADETILDPIEVLERQEAIKTAVSHFAELPTTQRSVVILKDVLDESQKDIAELLNLTVDAVKAHLARGRARLREINAHAAEPAEARPASAAVARYVTLFNAGNWDGLRALLADDVKLHQSTYPVRIGASDVGMFFTVYAKFESVKLAPAWVEDREVIVVFEDGSDAKPSYFMWLEWRGDRISFIRDYRYARYIMTDGKPMLAVDGEAAANTNAP